MDYLFAAAGLAVDAVVLFYVARLMNARNNNAQKAVATVAAAFFLGNLFGEFLISLLFSPLIALLVPFLPVILFSALILRLVIIKIVYGTGIGTAFWIWIITAIVSVIVSIWLPFY